VTLSGPDGDVGTAQKLLLKGDNPPVYRGSMDFSGDAKSAKNKKKNGPDIQSVSSGLDGGSQEVAQNDTPAAANNSGEVVASGKADSMIPTGAYSATPEEEEVKGHPSGCGCIVAGASESWSHGLLGGG